MALSKRDKFNEIYRVVERYYYSDTLSLTEIMNRIEKDFEMKYNDSIAIIDILKCNIKIAEQTERRDKLIEQYIKED